MADREPGADRARQLRTVLLAKQGFTAPEIATCTGFSRRTVQEWVARYKRDGCAGFQTKPGRGRKGPLTAEEAEQLKQRVEAGPLPEDADCTLRGWDIQRILHPEFGRLHSLNAVYALLQRLGYSSLVPRPQLPQADPAAQDEFKKEFGTRLAEIQAAHSGHRIQFFHEDETRFGQQGTLTRVWAKTGSRPRVVRKTQYGFVYVLVATCAETGQAEDLIAPRLDTTIVNLFFAQLSATLESDVQAGLVWDGAGYHRSRGLICPSSITLVSLPPYSQELNPVENLWRDLRSHHWSNRRYGTVDDLFDAAETTWRATCLDPDRIRTVCRAPYAETRG